MHVLGIGLGHRDANLLRRIEIDIEVGADQLHQFDVLEVDHVRAMTALNQCSLQLLLKPFHGIAEHNLFQHILARK